MYTTICHNLLEINVCNFTNTVYPYITCIAVEIVKIESSILHEMELTLALSINLFGRVRLRK